MTPADRLRAVYETYDTLLDATKVASRAIRRGDARMLAKTKFEDPVQDTGVSGDAADTVETSRVLLDEMQIVAMWAITERAVLDFFVALRDAAALQSSGPTRTLIELATRELEYWRFEELLDALKSAGVDSSLVGMVKNIKRYRDYLAHRNPALASVSTIAPEPCFQMLNTFLSRLATLGDGESNA